MEIKIKYDVYCELVDSIKGLLVAVDCDDCDSHSISCVLSSITTGYTSSDGTRTIKMPSRNNDLVMSFVNVSDLLDRDISKSQMKYLVNYICDMYAFGMGVIPFRYLGEMIDGYANLGVVKMCTITFQ